MLIQNEIILSFITKTAIHALLLGLQFFNPRVFSKGSVFYANANTAA